MGWASLDDVNQLITRFNNILKTLSPQDPLRIPSTLRLADALVDRAKIKESRQINNGCKSQCHAGHGDFKRALSLYHSVKNQVDPSIKDHIFFQIGYINTLLGHERQGIHAYNQVIRNAQNTKTSKAIKAKVYAALGEIFYKQGQFQKSKDYFLEAINAHFEDQNLAKYKIAWCNYRLGKIDLAVSDLFKLLVHQSKNNQASLFHEQISYDLATFLAKKSPQGQEIKQLYSLSPQNKRTNNLIYLANELVRLGHKKKAILVWKELQSKGLDKTIQLESHAQLFQLFFETNQFQATIYEIKSMTQIWNNTCNLKGSKCQDFKNNTRQTLTRWYKESQPNKFSEHLLKAHLYYLKLFINDIEITYQAAQLAHNLKSWKAALKLYDLTFQIQAKKIASLKSNSKAQQQKEALFLEDILINYITAADLSKNKVALKKAYKTYMTASLQKTQWLKVSYLDAKLFYDEKDYKKAAQALKNVALLKTKGSTKDKKIQMQAALLTLDSFAKLQNNQELEKTSLEFIKAFPKDSQNFIKANRVSLMNQMASENAQQAWQTLDRINLSGASDDEKIKYYKNRIILAGKLRLISDEFQFIEHLLKIKTLSPADKSFALSRKLYLSELILDFPTMYELAQQVKPQKITPAQQALKLAVFAQLARRDYTKHSLDFLKLSENTQKKFEVALKLFQEASNPHRFAQQHRSVLLHNPNLFADALLEHYLNDQQKNIMSQLLKQKQFSKTPAYQTFLRDKLLKDLSLFEKKIAQHQIRTNSQQVGNDLKQRFNLFTTLEKKAIAVIQLKDFISQVIALSLTKREAQRLHSDLMFMAIPNELNTDTEQQHLALLEKQAAIYKTKSSHIDSQMQKLFSSPDHLAQKLRDYFTQMNRATKRMAQSHLSSLMNYLSKNNSSLVKKFLESFNNKNLNRQIASDYHPAIKTILQDIRKDPFDIEKINQLIKLADTHGYETMAIYLKERRLVMLEKN